MNLFHHLSRSSKIWSRRMMRRKIKKSQPSQHRR